MKTISKMQKILLLWTLFALPLFAQSEITIYTSDNYRPYSYLQHGDLKGIHVDILRSIFAKMKNYRLKLQAIEWNEGLEKMKKSDILIMGNAFYRPKKRPYIIDYSDAYIYEYPAIYCNRPITIRDSNHIDWVNEFKGVTIAKQKGSNIIKSANFKEAIESKSLKIVDYGDEKNFEALIHKKIDCYINETLTLEMELLQKKREYKEDNQTLAFIDKIKPITLISKEGIHLAFSNKYFAKRNNLLKKINLAIKVMNNSGEVEKIKARYLNDFIQNDLRHRSIDASIYPLGSFVSDDMSNYGVLAEIVTTAFKDRNITVNYNYSSKNEAYLYNKWGKTCMSFPWTKGVDSWLYNELSEPIMTSDINFFYDKTNFPNGIEYRNLYDLKDYRIGGIKGAFYENFFSGMSFDYHALDNTKKALIALTLKKIDILPMNRHLFVDALKLYMPHKMEEFAHHEKPMTKKANYILFSKNCYDAEYFRDEFNKGFAHIQKNGTFDKILAKYTTSQKEKEEFEKIFRNLKKIEEAEEVSVFDINQSNHNDLNDSNLDISDSNITIDEANITQHINKGVKKP